MIKPLTFFAVVVLVVGSSDTNQIPWWNIRKFLSEVVNTGLGAAKLQEYFETGYQWQSGEVDGPRRLEQIVHRVSRDFNRSIEVVMRLKRVIEQEYGTWKEQPANSSTLCCEAKEHSSNGCALVVKHNRPTDTPLWAPSPPPSVVRELKHNQKLYPGGTYQYFAFSEGTLFMYPSISKKEVLPCEDYDPRLRYFYTQSISPEPRDVVVVVHSHPPANTLLKNIINHTFDALSLMDQVGLCLPGPDGCYTGSFGEENSFVVPSWPGPDPPLGRHDYLGQMLASNKKNKNHLKRLLELWPVTSPTFSSHMAAVRAGLQLLDSRHEFDLSAEGAKPAGIEEGIILKENNASLKVVLFPDNPTFRNSHTSLPSFGQNNNNRPVITIPYMDYFGMNYIITVCMPLVFQEEFVGTACIDSNVVNLFTDTTIHDIENAYVYLINGQGKALMHPLLPAPHSVTEDPATVTINMLEQHKTANSLLRKIISQEDGSEDLVEGMLVEALGWPPGTSQPNAVRRKRARLRFLWTSIKRTDLTLVLVLPLTDGKVVSTKYTCFNITSCETTNFHYHKPKLQGTNRTFCNFSGMRAVYNEGLVKFAPDCFNNMLKYLREEGDETISQIYSIFNGSSPFNELLRTDLRASVKLAETAVSVWKSIGTMRNCIGVQYMGTEDGVFISLPGTELKPTYDHRSKPWYQLTISSLKGDVISMTTPYCNKYAPSTMVYTLSRSLNNRHGTPLAVVAGDFTLQYIMNHFFTQVPDCKLSLCLLVDHMGYVVLKTNWLHEKTTPPVCNDKTDITAAHIIRLLPDLARDMIGSGLLRRRGCHDYKHDITFYYWWLNMRGHKTLHTGDTYELHKISSSNLYFVIGKQGFGQDNCHCNPYQEEELLECHDTCKMECECPCKAGPNTQPCHNAEADIHSSRWVLPPCKPSDPSLPTASSVTLKELQELKPCNRGDGKEEK
ncbi:uncharacterized protein LOC126995435 isoform X2 [Eriocheir sinensis]|uniref:uncharacterized protein LOC126995435 isoform X2 n=1 Tax=Eriocheir sinensis TaxID=95602 RepID=UPI0021C9DFA4|nr:uncharacterized protein LOC126995435 isoform X2 [Eriocheir sinensis]